MAKWLEKSATGEYVNGLVPDGPAQSALDKEQEKIGGRNGAYVQAMRAAKEA